MKKNHIAEWVTNSLIRGILENHRSCVLKQLESAQVQMTASHRDMHVDHSALSEDQPGSPLSDLLLLLA